MSQVSAIIVSYHTGPILYTAIASVLMQENLAEVIVVDNGNPPDIMARVQQMSLGNPKLRLLNGHGNIGFAAACNKGVRVANSEYVMLLNPDCILPPKALTTLVREMTRFPNTMLASPLLLNPDGREQRGGRRNLLTPAVALSEAFGLHRFGFKRLNNHGSDLPTATHDVQAISGACMCIRKVDYESLGGMDENYFLHVEDLDFCKRVADTGKRIICVPEVKVVHLLSTSGEATSAFVERHKARGFVRYFEKHFAGRSMVGTVALLKACIWGRYYLQQWLGKKKGNGNLDASRKLMILASSLAQRPHSTPLSGQTALVTGATSQVGIYVVKHLLASGVAVLAVSREEPMPFAHPMLKWLKTDLTSDDFSLGGFLADFAVHCAPQWHLPKIIPVLAEAEVGHVIAIGSTSIFSKAASGNHFEKDIVAKHTVAEAEIARLSKEHHMAYTILRPTMIYGAGLDKNIASLGHFIKRFGFFAVYPPAMGKRQPVHAEDVALASLQVASIDQARNKSYNVSGGEILGYVQMLERIFIALGKKPKIIKTSLLPFAFTLAGIVLGKRHINGEVAHRMNEDLVFFHDEAKQDFGYRPRPFLQGGRTDLEGMIWHG